MNVPGIACFTAIFLLCMPGGPPLAATDDPPQVSADGLHLMPDSRLGLVYADPEADLSGYDRLLLMDAQVAFRKNWQRDINTNKPYSVTSGDMQQIRADLAALFGEVFTQELKSAGYVLTDEQADDVLIVRPAIFDLNVSSPGARSSRTRNITQSAGDMTLYLELRDSITGDILIKALDFQFDRSNVTPHMLDRTRNERAARRILSDWAQTLVKGLDEAKGVTSGRQATE